MGTWLSHRQVTKNSAVELAGRVDDSVAIIENA